MRLILGAISLLIATVLTGLLLKSQLTTKTADSKVSAGKALGAVLPVGPTTSPQTKSQQSRQIQDQVQQSLDTAMQRPRISDDQ